MLLKHVFLLALSYLFYLPLSNAAELVKFESASCPGKRVSTKAGASQRRSSSDSSRR